MTWHTIKPGNPGGGRQRTTPAAKLYESGQLTINAAGAALLGYPDRVLLTVDPDAKRMRLAPTTPDNSGGFSLSGGGNTPHRIMCKEVVRRWPSLAGEYTVQRIAGGVELRIEAGEDGELEL